MIPCPLYVLLLWNPYLVAISSILAPSVWYATPGLHMRIASSRHSREHAMTSRRSFETDLPTGSVHRREGREVSSRAREGRAAARKRAHRSR